MLTHWHSCYVSLQTGNPALFTLLTVLIVPLLALTVGWLTQLLLVRAGIDLNSGRRARD